MKYFAILDTNVGAVQLLTIQDTEEKAWREYAEEVRLTVKEIQQEARCIELSKRQYNKQAGIINPLEAGKMIAKWEKNRKESKRE